jgi:hypothetical protein
MNQIHIVKGSDGNSPEITDITTGGFLVLYLQGDVIKSVGTIETKALTPIIMKAMAQKFSGG